MDDYKELRRYLERQDAWDEVKRFIQWLSTQNIFLATYQAALSDTVNVSRKKEMVEYNGGLEKLLADNDGFDAEEIERQKERAVRSYLNDLNLDD